MSTSNSITVYAFVGVLSRGSTILFLSYLSFLFLHCLNCTFNIHQHGFIIASNTSL